MAIRIFSGAIPRINYSYLASRLNVWGQAGRHAHSTSAKVEGAAKERFKEMPDLTFEEFKKTKYVDSFEQFQKSPYVQDFVNGDMEKVSQAYKDYCLIKFNNYLLVQYGGNPGTMI